MEFSCDAAHNQSYYSERKFMNSFTFHYTAIIFYFLLCPSPFVHLSLSLFSLCMFVFFLIILPPNTRLCWAATNYAEDQGQAWTYIRKAPGLYVFLCLSLSLFYLYVMTFIFCTFFFYFGCSRLLLFRALTAYSFKWRDPSSHLSHRILFYTIIPVSFFAVLTSYFYFGLEFPVFTRII